MLTNMIGDVTSPQTNNPCIVPHIVNDVGLWGSGVVIAVSNKWPEPRRSYLSKIKECRLKLGDVDFVQVEDDICIANMVGQKGVSDVHITMGDKTTVIPPIKYSSLQECMYRVAGFALEHKLEIHAPWFGTLRAGGEKSIIETMIDDVWCNSGLNVFMYEYKG